MSGFYEYDKVKCLSTASIVAGMYVAFLWVVSPFIPESGEPALIPGWIMWLMLSGVGVPVAYVSLYLGGLSGLDVSGDRIVERHAILPSKTITGGGASLSLCDMGNGSVVFTFKGDRFNGVDATYDDVCGGHSGAIRFFGVLATDEAKMGISDLMSEHGRRR